MYDDEKTEYELKMLNHKREQEVVSSIQTKEVEKAKEIKQIPAEKPVVVKKPAEKLAVEEKPVQNEDKKKKKKKRSKVEQK